MKKSVVVNGQKKQVEYIVISRKRIADYSKPSKKYSNCIAFDYINEWTISIDGKEAKVLHNWKQNGGPYSERWMVGTNQWVASEKKMIETILNR